MKNSIITIKPVTFIFSLLLATLVILLFHLMPSKTPNHSPFVMKDELQIALEKSSMGNKNETVIIAIINKAYVESGDDVYPAMFDLFLEGFWAGEGTRPLLANLLVVSMDQAAHERCEFRWLNCYCLATGIGGDEFAGEKVFMTDGFIEMMWRRTAFLLDVLNRGFSFIFTDTDVLWLRNPFTVLSNNETLDLQISTTWYNEKHMINTGFYFVRPNERTILLFETWYDMRKNATGKKEQDVLEDLIRDGVLEVLGLNTEFLDTLYFSGFCQDSRDVERVVTVHANCCQGIKAKSDDLRPVLMAWNSWFKGKGNMTTNFQWPKHTSCINTGLLHVGLT